MITPRPRNPQETWQSPLTQEVRQASGRSLRNAGRNRGAPGKGAGHRTCRRRGAARGTGPDPRLDGPLFSGHGVIQQGLTPEYLSQARDFFERSLALDPGNISAQVGAAAVHVMAANTYQTDDQTVRLASAEEALMGVLLRVPDHAYAHFLMGLTLTLTHRPSQGIAEYERALALDSNLAAARAHIGVTKHRLGCAEGTEADVQARSVSALATRTPTLGSHTLRPLRPR